MTLALRLPLSGSLAVWLVATTCQMPFSSSDIPNPCPSWLLRACRQVSRASSQLQWPNFRVRTIFELDSNAMLALPEELPYAFLFSNQLELPHVPALGVKQRSSIRTVRLFKAALPRTCL